MLLCFYLAVANKVLLNVSACLYSDTKISKAITTVSERKCSQTIEQKRFGFISRAMFNYNFS